MAQTESAHVTLAAETTVAVPGQMAKPAPEIQAVVEKLAAIAAKPLHIPLKELSAGAVDIRGVHSINICHKL